MGLFFARAKNHFYYGRKAQQYLNLFIALLTAVAAHGTYDYLATTCADNDLTILWLLAFVIVLDIVCILIIRKESKNDKPLISDNF
jgi:hypothetical protein